MTEFSKVREMLDRLLLLDAHCSPRQFEEALQNSSFIKEKLSKFQQRVTEKTYSAPMIQKVLLMEQDVTKIDAILNSVRSSVDIEAQKAAEDQLTQELFAIVKTAQEELFNEEASAREIPISEEKREMSQISKIAAEELLICCKNMASRIHSQRLANKLKAQKEEEDRMQLALENEKVQLRQQQEEARLTRERERLMKRRKMENLLQQHRRAAIEKAIENSSSEVYEFEFRMVETSLSTDSLTSDVPTAVSDVIEEAVDAENEQRLIEEAIELSLRPLSGEDPFNNKPEVQGS
jgi:hypothetical protein